jgi:uncharacterized protein (TIGR03086 family)
VTDDEELAVLRRGLDQLAGLVADVRPEAGDDPTPCTDWTVRDLVDHVVAAPTRFARMLREEPIDWTAPTPPPGTIRALPSGARRGPAGRLARAPRAGQDAGVDWPCAELAVHTWDLATAVHADTSGLDPEVAEGGLAFMAASLTPDNRGPVFGPERPAPEGGDAYGRIAAFAGRRV